MAKVTVVIKRNGDHEKVKLGMYGLSVHDQPGGSASVEPIDSEAELRERLLGFGLTETDASGLISGLKKKNDSVNFSVER